MAEVHNKRGLNESFPKETSERGRNERTLLRPNHVLRKRRPFSLTEKREKDIYVTNKTNFKVACLEVITLILSALHQTTWDNKNDYYRFQAQLNKCEKLFDAGASEVIIHALGAAINRACNLALQLKEIHYGTVELDVKTSTADLIDDFEPLNDDADYEVNKRHNSAIHIRVFRKALMGKLKYAQ